MDDIITIYHGSGRILENPLYGSGRKNNDYGRGFYCTEDILLAKEWAVGNRKDGFANRYLLDTKYLKTLRLNSPEYTIMNWIAILLEHRVFALSTPIAARAKRYIIDNFSVNVNAYDLIVGYRADDCYFEFAEAFVNNSITVSQLARAMKLGSLGEQIVLKSEFAFTCLMYDGYEEAPYDEYYSLRKQRSDEASNAYLKILEEDSDDYFIQDIIRGGITNNDVRIPRNVSLPSTKASGGSL